MAIAKQGSEAISEFESIRGEHSPDVGKSAGVKQSAKKNGAQKCG